MQVEKDGKKITAIFLFIYKFQVSLFLFFFFPCD